MDKDIGRIKKNEGTEVVVRLDEYKGKKGITIREYITSEKYTGFTKAGTRIPADKFLEFRDLINRVDLSELTSGKEVIKGKKGDSEEDKEEDEEEESLD